MKYIETKLMVLFTLAVVLSLSGCANISPLITGDGKGGGGGVAITTQQGGWVAPVVVGSGLVYLGSRVVDSLKDKSNNYNYYGDYTQNTAGNDNIVDSQNRETPKRIRAEVFLKRGK